MPTSTKPDTRTNADEIARLTQALRKMAHDEKRRKAVYKEEKDAINNRIDVLLAEGIDQRLLVLTVDRQEA